MVAKNASHKKSQWNSTWNQTSCSQKTLINIFSLLLKSVYGKDLLQRHLAITQVYHLYLPKRTPHTFLATFTRIYCFLHVLVAVASLDVKVPIWRARNERRNYILTIDLSFWSGQYFWLVRLQAVFFSLCVQQNARDAQMTTRVMKKRDCSQSSNESCPRGSCFNQSEAALRSG